MVNSQLLSIAQDQPYPLLFATLSGAHLYGFASEDSDYDLRGSHLLPVEDVIGLSTGPELPPGLASNSRLGTGPSYP